MAVITSREYFNYIYKHFQDVDSYELVALKKNIMTVPIEFLIARGNEYLLKIITEKLIQFNEAGLLQHWRKLVNHKLEMFYIDVTISHLLLLYIYY